MEKGKGGKRGRAWPRQTQADLRPLMVAGNGLLRASRRWGSASTTSQAHDQANGAHPPWGLWGGSGVATLLPVVATGCTLPSVSPVVVVGASSWKCPPPRVPCDREPGGGGEREDGAARAKGTEMNARARLHAEGPRGVPRSRRSINHRSPGSKKGSGCGLDADSARPTAWARRLRSVVLSALGLALRQRASVMRQIIDVSASDGSTRTHTQREEARHCA